MTQDKEENKKMGAARTAPDATPAAFNDRKGTPATYPLPPQYRKAIRFNLGGESVALKGGRALVLDLLIAAKSAGIDRASTLQWVANLSDTICALRARAIMIKTRKGHAANYALLSDVRRDGGAL
jgi:hypothetical protein